MTLRGIRYNYGFNNPVLYNDPEGDLPILLPLVWAIAEAVTVAAEGATLAAGGTAIAVGAAGLAANAPADAPLAVAYSPAVGLAQSTMQPGEAHNPGGKMFKIEGRGDGAGQHGSQLPKESGDKNSGESKREKAEEKLAKAQEGTKGNESGATDFVVNSKGEAVPIPDWCKRTY